MDSAIVCVFNYKGSNDAASLVNVRIQLYIIIGLHAQYFDHGL